MFPILLLLLIPQFLFANTIDSLLADNRIRAGVRAEDLFDPLDNRAKYDSLLTEGFPLCDWVDYRWLLANLPLADLAVMTKEDLFENIELASDAVAKAPWSATLTQEHYFHFILPHRVSQEPFVHWRRQFKDEITSRIAGLTLKESILEINHWCHEKATYKPTDGRDQDPLTTIRSGFGRCEEEMILTICALRSVGIPARQCYTPYWAHSDDNHAWVEAWGGDGWYYLGACEPAQELNQAWFTDAAKRAMLVVSTAYGDYNPPPSNEAITSDSPPLAGGVGGGVESEPVLRRFGRSTLINSTAVYGPTKELVVKVVYKNNRPAKNIKVVFSLWNYGTLMPATSVMTDSKGVARIVCGIGDWFVTAGGVSTSTSLAGGVGGGVKTDPIEDDALFWFTGVPKRVRTKIASFLTPKSVPPMAFAHVKAADTLVTLRLDSQNPAKWPTELDYTPPVAPIAKAPEVISAEGIARGITTPPLQSPLSIEGGVGGVALSKTLADSLFGARLAWEDSMREANVWGYDTAGWGALPEYAEYFRKARGNWGEVYKALTSSFPPSSDPQYKAQHHFKAPQKFGTWMNLFQSLSDKDFRDFSYDWQFSPQVGYYNNPVDDSVIVTKYLNSPRIDGEPSQAWRVKLFEFFVGQHLEIYSIWHYESRVKYDERSQYHIPYEIKNPSHADLIASEKKLLAWLRANIALEPTPDRLGPPLTPAQCLELRRGTESDIERLYIGLCRVRGIPARRNPVSGQVERWEEGKEWVSVNVLETKIEEKGKRKEEKGKLLLTISDQSPATSHQPPLYMKDWAVAKWMGNQTDVMDFGWHEPFEKISCPQELPVGWYLISSGRRRGDGSVGATLKWVEVKGEVSSELKIKN